MLFVPTVNPVHDPNRFASVTPFRFVFGRCSYLIVDIKQHHVVTSGHHEVHPGIVSVHNLVFGPVEDGVVY